MNWLISNWAGDGPDPPPEAHYGFKHLYFDEKSTASTSTPVPEG